MQDRSPQGGRPRRLRQSPSQTKAGLRRSIIFQRQEDIGNDTYPIHYYLGQSYWHTLVLYRAERELQAAWQIDSSDVNLAYSIAAVKVDNYRAFEDIKYWLDKALEMLEPDHGMLSRIHQQYGLGYYKLMDSWDNAIAHYKEAYKYMEKVMKKSDVSDEEKEHWEAIKKGL